MPQPRASLLALTLAAFAATPAFAQDPRGAAFDRLFEQIDAARLNPATQEEEKADLARLRALVPPGDRRRELLYRSMECFQPPEDARATLAFAKQGLADAQALGDAEAESRFQLCEAATQEMVGDPQHTITLYNRGIELARKSERPALVADGLVMRGNVYSFLGRQNEALVDFMTAQRLYDGSKQAERSEGNLQNIAVSYRRMGEYDKAREYLERSRVIAQKHQDWSSLLVIALQTGFMHEETGHPERALVEYEEAMRLSRQRLGAADTGATWLAIASAREARGEHAKTLDAVAQARTDFATVGDTSHESMLQMLEAQARAGQGDTARAFDLFAQAEKAFTAEGNERYLEMLYGARAAIRERDGDTKGALSDYKRFLSLREKRLAERSEQRGLMLRQQFDASRRDLEQERSQAAQSLREQEVRALRKARRWQRSAIGLGVALILVLGIIVGRQIVRTRKLRVLALTDELTGVANRRRIELAGEEAVARARGDERPLSVIAFDIDGFKDINDRHGHLAGDQVIARVADACHQALRQFDEIGRTGGEEFVVLLPDSTIDAASQVAERLRAGVEALDFSDVAAGLKATISVGVAALEPRDAGLAALLARADQALYRAKAVGRNCVRVG